MKQKSQFNIDSLPTSLYEPLEELAAVVNSYKNSEVNGDILDEEDISYDGDYMFDTPIIEIEKLLIQVIKAYNRYNK